MRISVVIPVLEDRLELREQMECLEDKICAQGGEVIVVDASTIDPVQTSDLSERVLLLRAQHANRAYQENLGASVATGEILLFLHADTRLPEGALEAICQACEDSEVVGGGFEREFEPSSWFLGLTCQMAGWRGRKFGWFLGDQALFVRKEIFEEVGGFALLTAFEDYDFCRRLKKEGELCCLYPSVVSSARRFAHGAVWRSLCDFLLTVHYWVRGTRPYRAIQFEEIKEGAEPPNGC